MNWKIALENYKTYLVVEKALSTNSIDAYLNDLKKLISFLEKKGVENVECCTCEQLSNYLQFIDNENVNPRTKARTISTTKSFFNFLMKEEVIGTDISTFLKSPKITRKTPTILNAKEIQTILEAVELFKPEGQRNKAIIEMLYGCGLRVSELINLKVSDINFRKKTVTITNNKNTRQVPLTENAKKEILLYIERYRNYLKVEPDYQDVLFLNKRGSTLSRVMIFNIIKSLIKRTELKKQVSPHTFRHSFASHQITQGKDLIQVKEMLGHSSVLTTEIYLHK